MLSWSVLLAFLGVPLVAGIWIDWKRRGRGPGAALHRDAPEKHINPYGMGNGGGIGGDGSGGG